MKKLESMRKKIDAADRAILKSFAVRAKAARKIGKIKKEKKLPLFQKGRWGEVLKDRVKRGAKLGLSKKFILSVWKAIHEESIRIQKGKC